MLVYNTVVMTTLDRLVSLMTSFGRHSNEEVRLQGSTYTKDFQTRLFKCLFMF